MRRHGPQPPHRDGGDPRDAPRDNVAADAGGGPVRLDLWLWAARFYKTRPLAADAVGNGHARLDDQRSERYFAGDCGCESCAVSLHQRPPHRPKQCCRRMLRQYPRQNFEICRYANGRNVTIPAVRIGVYRRASFRRPPLLKLASSMSTLPSQTRQAAAVRPLRVLIVDDLVDAAEALARLLRYDHHEVRTTYQGEAALTAALRACTGGRPARPGSAGT